MAALRVGMVIGPMPGETRHPSYPIRTEEFRSQSSEARPGLVGALSVVQNGVPGLVEEPGLLHETEGIVLVLGRFSSVSIEAGDGVLAESQGDQDGSE